MKTLNLVLFAHPVFAEHKSMPRYVQMLEIGMKKRGYQVEVWSPTAKLFKIPLPKPFKKWLGYVDQYVLFPREVRKRLSYCTANTLFVFTDHSLGPWIPLVSARPHAIHCHDFTAQLSATGKIVENCTGWTGRKYQMFIRNGFTQGKFFISVSKQTQEHLKLFLKHGTELSEVVYNGLNNLYQPLSPLKARTDFSEQIQKNLGGGYILHVGGNQWYKNRRGVIEIYEVWRTFHGGKLPLLLIGEAPCESLKKVHNKSPYQKDIFFFTSVSDQTLRLAYAGASVFLFPSLEEGFGWPIAEAMACGCPVITTRKAPMTEVGGSAAFFIARRPERRHEVLHWAVDSARMVERVISMTSAERAITVEAGLKNAKRFDAAAALDKIEGIYRKIFDQTDYQKHRLKVSS